MNELSEDYISRCVAIDIINDLPSKRGKWKCGTTLPTKIWFCSACDNMVETAYYLERRGSQSEY